MLKKFFLFILFVMMCYTRLLAYTNLREGIVITLESDTLHGSIEYRTDYINCQRCTFIQDGSNEEKIFHPGEIIGYRFMDNGRYYVSMSFKVKDSYTKKESEVLGFVEYVMKGNMSLYYAPNQKTYILQNEDGEFASFTELNETINHPNSIRRAQLAEATALLSSSTKASSLLWRLEKNIKNARKVVQVYNDDVCPDGVCELFEYQAAKIPNEDRLVRFNVMVGACTGTIQPYKYQRRDELNKMDNESVTFISPMVSLGSDICLDRLLTGFLIKASLQYFRLNSSSSEAYKEKAYQYSLYNLKSNAIGLKIIPAYQFTLGRFKPYVGAGYNFQAYCGTEAYFAYGTEKYMNVDRYEYKIIGTAPAGFSFTLGSEYSLRKGALVLNLDASTSKYEPLNEQYVYKFVAFSGSVGYVF